MTEPDYTYYCRPCNSPRPDLTCWKCRGRTSLPHPKWSNTRQPPVGKIRSLGREVGYSIAVHGSQQRDLDLIAAPWTPEAVSVEALIQHLCTGLGAREVGGREVKPHGRVAVNISMDGWYQLIDLSICPKT